MGKVHEQMLLPNCALLSYLAGALPGERVFEGFIPVMPLMLMWTRRVAGGYVLLGVGLMSAPLEELGHPEAGI